MLVVGKVFRTVLEIAFSAASKDIARRIADVRMSRIAIISCNRPVKDDEIEINMSGNERSWESDLLIDSVQRPLAAVPVIPNLYFRYLIASA